jgi:hypothetical protein
MLMPTSLSIDFANRKIRFLLPGQAGILQAPVQDAGLDLAKTAESGA